MSLSQNVSWPKGCQPNACAAKSPSAKCLCSQMSVQPNVHTAKCPCSQMSMQPNVHAAKCLCSQMSMQPNVRAAKCPCSQMSMQPKCPSVQCHSTKRRVTKKEDRGRSVEMLARQKVIKPLLSSFLQ